MKDKKIEHQQQNELHGNIVQIPIKGYKHESHKKQKFESFLIFLFFGLIYGFIGYYLVTQYHVVSFESLDRLARAFFVWHNDPAKLASIGFSSPPLSTMFLLPLTIFPSMATSLIALPISSAFFGGLLMMTTNRMLARCEMAAIFRYIILIVFGLNPLIIFYAVNGGVEIISLAALASGIGCLIAWYNTVDTRYLIAAGSVFSVAVLIDYTLIIWMIIGLFFVIMILIHHKARFDEVEGTAITFVIPSVYALTLWTILNGVIIGQPFYWITNTASTAAVNAASVSKVGTNFIEAFYQLLEMIAYTSPIAFAVLPVLIIVAVVKHSELAAWLAGFIFFSWLIPFATALITNDLSVIQYSDGLVILFISLVACAWLYYLLDELKLFVLIGTFLLLVLSAYTSWYGMDKYQYQNLEESFKAAVTDRASQDGEVSKGGIRVGLGSELATARFVNNLNDNKKIITDNSQTSGVIILSGEPARFINRIDEGDGAWLEQLDDPNNKYILIAKNSQNDLVREKYPRLFTGVDPNFELVYSNARYSIFSYNPS